MFTGSVCAHAREWFKTNSGAFAGKKIVCGCSGNFTIETVLSQAPNSPSHITSSDISLYSTALGVYFSGAPPVKVTIAKEYQDIAASKIKTPLGLAATLVVLLEVAPFASRKTAYHIRMCDRILDNFEQYYEIARMKLKARKRVLKIDSYLAVDVREVVANRHKRDVFLSFMPTYAGGYERLYKFIDEIFEWKKRPKCEMLTADDKDSMLGKIHQQGNYVHVDDKHREFMPTVAVIRGGRSKPVYIHSDIKVQSDVYQRSKVEHTRPNQHTLDANESIESDAVILIPLTTAQFAWVRDQYLSLHITPADPSWKFGVCIDGKLIGVIGWSRGQDGEKYYLTCDLSLPSNKYKRLSKLVVSIANSKEMLGILRQKTGRFWSSFTTTAFTVQPISMKYRGVLDLHNKKPGLLNYAGTFNTTIQKAVKKWRKLEKKAT